MNSITKTFGSNDEYASSLHGTLWRSRKKNSIYRIERSRRDEVYLVPCPPEKGARSTWKYVGLLVHDYERVDQ